MTLSMCDISPQELAVIEVYDPGNLELLGTVPSASQDDVEKVLATASQASDIARNMPTHLRISVLRQVAEQLLKRHEEFARVIAKEGIKTLREARKEVSRCIETMRISAEEARRLGGETIAFDQMPGSENRFGYFKRLPVGVGLQSRKRSATTKFQSGDACRCGRGLLAPGKSADETRSASRNGSNSIWNTSIHGRSGWTCES